MRLLPEDFWKVTTTPLKEKRSRASPGPTQGKKNEGEGIWTFKFEPKGVGRQAGGKALLPAMDPVRA